MKVQSISETEFIKKFHVKIRDPWQTPHFSEKDMAALRNEMGYKNFTGKLCDVCTALPSLILHRPLYLLTHIKELAGIHLNAVKMNAKISTHTSWEIVPSLKDYVLKGSIIASFKPGSVLEIGTGAGWGICLFASVNPGVVFTTMSPRLDQSTGSIVKKKPKLHIKQIWADSLKYNFSKMKPVDVTYIDGNHTYPYVYSDLKKASKKTRKMILLDDYIPSPHAKRDPIIRWASYFLEVVNAVADFLKNEKHSFRHAYWLRGTKICVLVK